jgi:N utilization substance protein B
MALGRRRRARIAALQALYERDTSNHEVRETLARIAAEERLPADSVAFAKALIEGVLAQQDEIDRVIAKAAPAWPVDQLAAIDRNVLRLAIREMLGDNGAPVRAVINEAVELAKSFGSDNSAKFVNGVLGSIERQRAELQAELAKGRG